MTSIVKCSLNGLSEKISDSLDFYKINDQISYFPDNNFIDSSGETPSWFPFVVDSSTYGKYCLTPSLKSFSSLSYVVDIADTDDYIFALKIKKVKGFNIFTEFNIRLTYPSVIDNFPENHFSPISTSDRDLFSNYNSVVDISNIQHNMAQVVEDSVWITLNFSALTPGRYVFEFFVPVTKLEYIRNLENIFFVEGFTAFRKLLFSENGLLLTGGKLQNNFDVKVYRPLAASVAQGAIVQYVASLNGSLGSPPNSSPGTGNATFYFDTITHLLTISVSFSGLVGTTTVAHIHADTSVSGTGIAGVALELTGFSAGLTTGTYSTTINLLSLLSYSSSYLSAHGGTATSAETDLLAAMTDGRAYLNIHSNLYPGGEISGSIYLDSTPSSSLSPLNPLSKSTFLATRKQGCAKIEYPFGRKSAAGWLPRSRR